MSEVRYVLKSVESGKYIALDQSSGGCHYEVDSIWRAKFWETPQDAIRYTAVMSWSDYDHPVFSLHAASIFTERQIMPTGENLGAVRNGHV